ncbi:hypothetical protein [Actinoplanes sp. G11-F43]
MNESVPLVSNSDVDGDSFDSDACFRHDYRDLRADDAQIITIVADIPR